MENREYSLALGGGAARGFAHVGVIKAMEESLMKVVEVSGTSMGSIIAGCLAIGMNSTDMKKLADELKYRKLVDWGSKDGLVGGDKIYEKLREIYGDVDIEDCEIPVKIIATDFDSGEKVIFDKGKLVDAIRASISVPLVFVPYTYKSGKYPEYDGRYLMDGGISSNLPIEVLEGDNVIAVSVIRDLKRKIITHHEFFGGKLKIPKNAFGIQYQIGQKAIDIMMSQNEKASLRSKENVKLIHPSFPGIDYFEFHKYDEIIEIGYQEAKEQFNIK